MGRLQNGTALVTGAASGIGFLTARRMIEEGARVAMTDINEAGLAVAAGPLGDSVLTIRHDVTSEESWIHAIRQAVAVFGRLSILVNSAGTGRSTNVEETTLEDWR